MITFESVYRSREHILTLYDLLKERTPEQSISHKEMPTMQAHQKFVYSQPYFLCNIIKDEEGKSIGSIYLTHQREVGIFIFEKYQRKGYAEQAIKLLMSICPGRILANVNPENNKSINLFKKLGAKHIQNTYELDGITWTDRDL